MCRYTHTRGIRGRFQKPPPNYVCHSCGGKDHFRQQCPKGKVGWMIVGCSVFLVCGCVCNGVACSVLCVGERVCVCVSLHLLSVQGEAQATAKRATGFPRSHLVGVSRQGPGVLRDNKGNLVIPRADV